MTLTDEQIREILTKRWAGIRVTPNINESDIAIFRLGVEQERKRCAEVCRIVAKTYHDRATITSLEDMALKNYLRGKGSVANECAETIERGQ